MSKEVFENLKNNIKKEARYIGLLFLISLVILKIVFFKEDILVVFRYVLSLFWLFVLPGYCAMLYWKEKIDFMERIIIGVGVSAGIIGIFSYYFGLIGLDIKYHTVILPLLIILISLVFVMRKTNP